MSRLGDPPLINDPRAPDDLPTASLFLLAQEQARLVMQFMAELERCGLSHEEALWLTAQVWRSF